MCVRRLLPIGCHNYDIALYLTVCVLRSLFPLSYCRIIIISTVYFWSPSSTEDPTDLGLVKTGMVSVLQVDTQAALAGIFGQILGEDEGVREKGIDYVCNSLPSMRHKLFIPHPENEKFLLGQIQKVSFEAVV